MYNLYVTFIAIFYNNNKTNEQFQPPDRLDTIVTVKHKHKLIYPYVQRTFRIV